MKRINLLILVLLILIVALGIAIYLRNNSVPEEQITTSKPVPVQEPVKKPIVHYPVPEQSAINPVASPETTVPPTPNDQVAPVLPEALPKVQQSDQSIEQAVHSLVAEESSLRLLLMDNFIQKLVATIDNLPEKKLPRIHLPIRPPKGKFIVAGTPEAPQTSSRNNQRYTPYVALFKAINPELAVKVYVHFYPLFQQAYEELGYHNAYFNDRLVFVLDHLLDIPNPADPILLEQPVVLYTYADPALENRSAGQKLLLRIGHDNRTEILQLLKRYRTLVTNLHP